VTQITLEDAQRQLPDLIEAAVRGEEVVITRADRPAVRLVPVDRPRPDRKAGSAKGKILYMADDFDAPLEDFKEYME
jgi:prevent-host-death family protein